MHLIFVLIVLLTFSASNGLPPCGERAGYVEKPLVNSSYCLELALIDDSGGEMSFTSLTASADGTLYATRPRAGEVYALQDTNSDGLPDTVQLLVDGLRLPNAMTEADGTLYIVGANHVYRWQEGELSVLIDDLPYNGLGPWNGGIAVSDEFIYVGVAAGCDFCVPQAGYGVIMRYSLDGENGEIYAQGFRNPAALLWWDDALWATDSTQDSASGRHRDEIYRVEQGKHYGFPYCFGMRNFPQMETDFDCSSVPAANVWLRAHTFPMGLAPYSGDAFPGLRGQLLVSLAGGYAVSSPSGFALISINPADSAQTYLVPSSDNRIINRELQGAQLGFAPRHLYGMAVGPQGWIYLSAAGGRIYVLRPASLPLTD